MEYHFNIHKEAKGYWADCVELKGCLTQADNLDELTVNMANALNLYLDEAKDSKLVFPSPKKSVAGRNIVKVPVDSSIAFAFLLRRLRLKHQMTQEQAAKKMGFKNTYSYQRLEFSKTANPGLSTLVLIKSVFPDFKMDEVLPRGVCPSPRDF